MVDISSRKDDHLDLTIGGDVGFRKTSTLFECVQFVHDALPELDVDEVDLSTRVLGKRLTAPILIAGMTGGSDRARDINRALATLAESEGVGLGLGSQRAMLKRKDARASYQIRDLAPTALLLGNIGAVQVRDMTTAEVEDLVQTVGADALCVHLNPAMEVVQTEGDRTFRGCVDAIARLVSELSVPVVAKETGCGLSLSAGRRLAAAGVRHVDVSGAGGTSWVAVETLRAAPEGRQLGEAFWDWGIPTAASVAMVAACGFKTIFATGGLNSGLDVARAIALGASVGGFARPILQALDAGGSAGAAARIGQIRSELRTAMLLTGSANVAALRDVPRVVRGELADWMEQIVTRAR